MHEVFECDTNARPREGKKKKNGTVSESDTGLISVDVVENAFVSDLTL